MGLLGINIYSDNNWKDHKDFYILEEKRWKIMWKLPVTE